MNFLGSIYFHWQNEYVKSIWWQYIRCILKHFWAEEKIESSAIWFLNLIWYVSQHFFWIHWLTLPSLARTDHVVWKCSCTHLLLLILMYSCCQSFRNQTGLICHNTVLWHNSGGFYLLPSLMKGQSGSHYNFDIKSTWNIITIPNAGTNWPSMIVHQNQCLMRQGDCNWPKHCNLMCWNAIILHYIAAHDIVEEEQLLLTHVEFCLHQLCHDRKICLNFSSPRLSACCCCPAPALQCFCYTELRIRDVFRKNFLPVP